MRKYDSTHEDHRVFGICFRLPHVKQPLLRGFRLLGLDLGLGSLIAIDGIL